MTGNADSTNKRPPCSGRGWRRLFHDWQVLAWEGGSVGLMWAHYACRRCDTMAFSAGQGFTKFMKASDHIRGCLRCRLELSPRIGGVGER